MSISMTRTQSSTYPSRMGAYLAEMFPLQQRVPAAILLYSGFAVSLQVLQGWEPRLIEMETIYGGLSVFLLLLLLRLMDELKDRDVDEALFPGRPLPSGRVRESDIRVSILLTGSAFVFMHAWLGSTFIPACIVLGYAVLMFRFFFMENLLRNSLPLTLLTHNPVVPLMLILLVWIAAAGEGVAVSTIDRIPATLLIGQYWGMSFSWEIARKIRSTDEEDAYVTYSRIFGRSGAVMVALAGQLVSFGAGVVFVLEYGFSWQYLAVLLAGLSFPVGASIRFLNAPTDRTSRLRPFAEVYMLAVMAAGLVEYAVRSWDGNG